MFISDAIKLCLEQASALRAEHTARVYGNGIDKFLKLIREDDVLPFMPLEKITVEHFVRFPFWLTLQKNKWNKPFSKKTLGVYISGTKFFLDWLVINKYLSPTYEETIRYHQAVKQVYRKHESTLPRTPDPKDVARMVEAVYDLNEMSPQLERNIALIEFLYSTGCRINEAVTLAIGNIDLEKRTAKVVGKGNKERYVYFSQAAANALRKYWVIRGFRSINNPAFCRHDRGAGRKVKPMTTATGRNVVKAVCFAAGVDTAKFTPHRFRHAFGTKMLKETKNLALVQDLMGHSDPKSTRVYAKITPDELMEAHHSVYG